MSDSAGKSTLFDIPEYDALLEAARAYVEAVDRDVSVTVYSENPTKGSSAIYFESPSKREGRREMQRQMAERFAEVKISMFPKRRHS